MKNDCDSLQCRACRANAENAGRLPVWADVTGYHLAGGSTSMAALAHDLGERRGGLTTSQLSDNMQARRFENKQVVITGGNSGIGLAAARGFADEGARVMIVGRDPTTLEEARCALGQGHVTMRANLDSVAEVRRVAALVERQFGTVDVLLACAAIIAVGPSSEVTEEQWDRLMSVNLKCAFFLTQQLVPRFTRGGSIVFCSSAAGVRAYGGSLVYGTSKAALRYMARSFASELARSNIRVNALVPGATDTPLLGRVEGLSVEAMAQFKHALTGFAATKRLGTPQEVAAAALFLASDEASFVTGAEFVVDGGLLGTA
jgi:NAD(P)-dependent dehydrogenase (short-subunit alcohol dehydrogenase family)